MESVRAGHPSFLGTHERSASRMRHCRRLPSPRRGQPALSRRRARAGVAADPADAARYPKPRAARGKAESLMQKYAGRAAIGHVRYATCGEDDVRYAQPFERHHLEKRKWFAFGFNGQLANFQALRDKLLSEADHHLARENDTEIIMHEISRELSGDRRPRLVDVMRAVSQRFDGAYSIVFLNAQGDLLIARDPLGIKPLCYAKEGNLFAAASESVPLLNLGFHPESIKSLPPGHAITITGGEFKIEPFAAPQKPAHCYFEWIYFA